MCTGAGGGGEAFGPGVDWDVPGLPGPKVCAVVCEVRSWAY